MLLLSNKSTLNDMKVKIGYMSGKTEMYVRQVKKEGTIYATTDIRKGKKFKWLNGLALQLELTSEGFTTRKIYF